MINFGIVLTMFFSGKWLNIDDYIEQIMAYDETSNRTVIQTGGCRTEIN